MLMHSLWNGSISFGLVNIPIHLYSGSTTHQGIDLTMLHKADNSPIRYARTCKEDGAEVPYDDIVKGYEYSKGQYVVLSPEDFKKANARKTSTIDIKQFVSEDEIDVRYYEKPYLLEPDKGGDKAYALLREALERSDKVALVKYVLREREAMGVIKPVKNVLVLNQMRFPADLKSLADLNIPVSTGLDEKEIKLALSLINQQTKHFIEEDWHDSFTEELEDILHQKVKGKHPKTKGSAPKATHVKDLMNSLKASLDKPTKK